MSTTYKRVCTLLLLSAAVGLGQSNQYVEIWTAKVRQDRVAEFGTIATRVADANRKNGDHFVAFSDFYGKDNRVSIAMPRASAAEIEPAMGKFMGSLKEYLGMTPDRFMADISRLIEEGYSELRLRRPDLSSNIADDEAWARAVGSARYMMTISLKLKPGRIIDAEKQLLMVKQKSEANQIPTAISQVVAGRPGSYFYVSRPMKSIADLDQMPGLRATLGDEAYEQFQESVSRNFESSEYRIMRIVPEWSNPPKMVADADPKFWAPKPASKPKAKPAPEAKPGS